MTVIAVRNRIMAADRLMICGGVKSESSKICRLPDGSIFGGSGDDQLIELFRLSLIGRGKRPDLTSAERDQFHVLVLRPDGSVEEWCDPRCPIVLTMKFYAIGTGAGEAMAAMHMGASASRAVQIASLVDSRCGLGVDAMIVPRKK